MGKLIKKLPQNYGNPHLTDFDHNLRDQNCLNDLACSNFPPTVTFIPIQVLTRNLHTILEIFHHHTTSENL